MICELFCPYRKPESWIVSFVMSPPTIYSFLLIMLKTVDHFAKDFRIYLSFMIGLNFENCNNFLNTYYSFVFLSLKCRYMTVISALFGQPVTIFSGIMFWDTTSTAEFSFISSLLNASFSVVSSFSSVEKIVFRIQHLPLSLQWFLLPF